MNLAGAYVEMVNRSFKLAQQEGCRPFPLISLEIMLLEEAKLSALERELTLFQRLCRIFDWKLTRRQRRSYLNGLRDGKWLVLTDLSEIVRWTSQSSLAATGYSPSKLIGGSPGLFRGLSESIARRVEDQLQKKRSVSFAVCRQRRSGEPYRCQVTIDPLCNSQGELTHYLSIEVETKTNPR